MIGKAAKDILIHIKGDDKDFQNTLQKTDTSMGTFAAKMKAYGPMINAAFASAAVGFVAMSVKWAAAEEVVSRQTEALLKSQGVLWKDVGKELDAYMKQLEELTSYNDTDLQVAFNTMIAAGMSYTEALESMNTVTSMSFSLNRDLESMAMLVGKAYNGQTGELSRYGIVLDDSLDKSAKFIGLQEYVNKNFADASERSQTLQGQLDNVNNQFHNIAEAIGVELLPPLTEFLQKVGDWATAGGAERLVASLMIVGKSAYIVADSFKMMAHGMEAAAALDPRYMGGINMQAYGAAIDKMEDDADNLGKTYRSISEQLGIVFGEGGNAARNNFIKEAFPTGSPSAQGASDGAAYGQAYVQSLDKYTRSWQMTARSRGITSANLASLGVEGESRTVEGGYTIRPATESEMAIRSGI